MTMVAAVKIDEVPMLFGDCMVSGSVETVTRVARRKIVRLAGNLVVGWLGNYITAATILREFNESQMAGNDNISKVEFEQFLLSYQDENFHEMHTELIGWIVEDRPECFLWKTNYPSMVFFQDPPIIDGTGDQEFLVPYQHICVNSTQNSNIDALDTMTKACSIMMRLFAEFQVKIHTNERIPSWGIAYELLVWTGSSFEYLEETLYGVFVTKLNERSGLGPTRKLPFFVKVLSHANYMEMIQYNHVAKEYHIYFALPPGLDGRFYNRHVNPETKARYELLNSLPVSMKAARYCLCHYLEWPNEQVSSPAYIHELENNNLFVCPGNVIVSGAEIYIRLDSQTVSNMIRNGPIE